MGLPVDAADGPNGAWVEAAEQTDAAGFVTYGVIWIPDNIESTAGLSAPGGCRRLRSLLAHELGHGMFGEEHSPGSIMQGGNFNRPYYGLDDLPDGPTPCDRDAENWARNYNDNSPTDGGLNQGCGPNEYQDSHGCPCEILRFNLAYTGQNLKPMVHQQWPRTGLYAPFSGNLDLHTDDANGHVWRVDYFLNGQFLLTSTSPPFGFHFNVQPGNYTIQAAAYDNDDAYSMSAPQTISVCGSPPYGANWLQYTKTPTGLGGYWVTLSWPAVPMANNYRIEASTSVGGPANLGTWVVGNVTSWVAGPVGHGSFWVRVRSGNPCGWGFASADHNVVVP